MPSGTFTTGGSKNVVLRATGSDLPQQVQKAVPSCAYSCLSAYVQQEFACSTNDYTCLCSRYTSQGLTLGELAFICTNVGCNGQSTSTDVLANAYRVCSSDSSAARPTHNTLTPPALQPTTSVSIPVSIPAPTTTTMQTATTRASSQLSSEVATAQPETIYTASASSSMTTQTTAPVASAASSGGSSDLTSSQAVGVSVGAFGAVAVAIGIVYFIASYRRRQLVREKRQKRGSYDFVDDAPHQFSPFHHGTTGPRGPLAGFALFEDGLGSEKPKTQPQSLRSHRDTSTRYPTSGESDYRHYGTNRSMSPDSYCSDRSERTSSALLPAKPERLPVRPQVKSDQLATMYTPATVFKEYRGPPSPALIVPGLPSHPGVAKAAKAAKAAMAQQNPTLPRQPQYAGEYTGYPEQIRQPQLSLKIPRQPPRSDSMLSLGPFPLPPAPTARPSTQRALSDASKRDSSSSNGVLSYYASPDSGNPPFASTPIDERSQVRRPAPAAITVTKPTYPPRVVRGSTGSEVSNRTSFESSNLDEPTPPEDPGKEANQLSPVTESPISNIRYPKIPRSSAQVVPRSSAQVVPRSPVFKASSSPDLSSPQRRAHPHTSDRNASPRSGTTLAARRNVDRLGRGLPFPPRRSSPNGSPLQGYALRSSQRNTPNWPLRVQTEPEPMQSPGWKPSKLTPRREGDDMYLAVSVATPMNANFRR